MKTPFSFRFPSVRRPAAALFAAFLAGLVLAAPPVARAQVAATLQNLARFNGGSDGVLPDGPLVQGPDGNLYGTTTTGGTYQAGTLYKATLTGTITTLYSFGNGSDGQTPVGGLTLGSDGNFYGTTSGYTRLPRGPYNGTIFRYAPGGMVTTLHQFSGVSALSLVQGRDGNFYGVVPAGNASTDVSEKAVPGIVFRITPTGDFVTLHTFDDDSQNPSGKLVQGRDGNFYGVTRGVSGGTVFQITPDGVFTNFGGVQGYSGGANPNGGLVQAPDGDFYGTTSAGGGSGDTIFRLDSGGGFSTLHVFNGNDGTTLRGGLTLGSDGNLYGTTGSGGVGYTLNPPAYIGYGTIFQITPAGVFTTLYNFSGDDGSSPNGPLSQAGNGLFYGTTAISAVTATNDNFAGQLFSLAVSTRPAFFAGEVALTRGVYYLAFPNQNYFGYYTFLGDGRYIYHFDLGFEYVFDAADGKGGVYLYDFASGDFLYTSPVFPFPYLYDFGTRSVLYYYPASAVGHYTKNPRYFYDFGAGKIITR